MSALVPHQYSATREPKMNQSFAKDPSDKKESFLAIERLRQVGVGTEEIIRLKEAGFHTIERIAHSATREIACIEGIGDKEAENILQKCMKFVDMGFSTALDVYEKRKNILKIRTGSLTLDTVIGGGIESRQITEVFGESGAGKSHLCHSLAVICQLPVSMGGADGKCIWIDTEGSFRPERLISIAQRYGIEARKVLDNIAFAKCFNSDHQTSLLTSAGLYCSFKL
ncbi:hypothetical protein RB195_008115 [Necator americanus]|uniref:RecA family profile 1 domain-containing protein n=1 Tax=Necator americanus TaxID=51031 RepID=A0ABR1CP07_NECAM